MNRSYTRMIYIPADGIDVSVTGTRPISGREWELLRSALLIYGSKTTIGSPLAGMIFSVANGLLRILARKAQESALSAEQYSVTTPVRTTEDK